MNVPGHGYRKVIYLVLVLGITATSSFAHYSPNDFFSLTPLHSQTGGPNNVRYHLVHVRQSSRRMLPLNGTIALLSLERCQGIRDCTVT